MASYDSKPCHLRFGYKYYTTQRQNPILINDNNIPSDKNFVTKEFDFSAYKLEIEISRMWPLNPTIIKLIIKTPGMGLKNSNIDIKKIQIESISLKYKWLC